MTQVGPMLLCLQTVGVVGRIPASAQRALTCVSLANRQFCGRFSPTGWPSTVHDVREVSLTHSAFSAQASLTLLSRNCRRALIQPFMKRT
eukprot:COSAG06_NODE_22606_length_718_cov_0.966074_2_plen_89_part_01